MGLISQLTRGIQSRIKGTLKGIRKRFFRKKTVAEDSHAPLSWRKKKTITAADRKNRAPDVIKHKIRIPHLLFFKRLLAGFLLLINFVFSQFLLGAIGTGAQPMFILFLLNSLILIDYLWKTRKAAD